jgi:hypothetical protein
MNDSTTSKTFKQFARMLEERLSKYVHTTEDSVRYTLFYCLATYGGISASEIILEYPHPQISGAELDTYIPPTDVHPGLAIEFKFDRGIPSKRNLNKTQKAGKVFADIFRLALIEPNNKNIQRYLVFITDKEMATYFQNPSNKLIDFFALRAEETLRIDREYIENHPDTFVKSAGKYVVDCTIVGLLREEFRQKIWVRIYEIKPASFSVAFGNIS